MNGLTLKRSLIWVATAAVLLVGLSPAQATAQGNGNSPQLSITNVTPSADGSVVTIDGVNFGPSPTVYLQLNSVAIPVAVMLPVTPTRLFVFLGGTPAAGSYRLHVSRGPSTTSNGLAEAVPVSPVAAGAVVVMR